ncbi:MAG: ABC transporter substrate-binding protein [Bacillota bacterium]
MKKLLIALLLVFVMTLSVGAVELDYWGYPRWNKDGVENGWFEQEVIEAFEDKYPEVEINFQTIPYNGGPEKVNMAIASNTTPDIIYDGDSRLLSYAAQGKLVPFELTETENNNIYKSVKEFCEIDDKLYVYPTSSYISAITINKSIAEKAGYDIPEDRHWTIEEFKEFLTTIKPYVKVPFGFGINNEQGDDRIRLFLQNYGPEYIVDGEVVINQPEAVEGLKYLKELQKEGLTYRNPGNVKATEVIQDYLEGNVGAIIYGGSYFLSEDNIEKVDSIMMASPHPEGLKPKHVATFNAFGIFDNGDKEKIEYAKKFVRFFINNYNKEATRYLSRFSAWKNTVPAYDLKEMWILQDFLEYTTYKGSDLAEYGQLRARFYPEMQAVFADMKEPAEALEDFQNKANKILK